MWRDAFDWEEIVFLFITDTLVIALQKLVTQIVS